MMTIRITNQTNPQAKAIEARFCKSFLCQLRGLMFRKELAEAEGLILVQGKDSKINASIHMMFMRMDLAVIWINSKFEVVDKVLAHRWKAAYLPKSPAKYILETGVWHLSEYNNGDLVTFEEN